MKNKCIIIPLENYSKNSPRYNKYVNKAATNKKSNNHMSFDLHPNFYQKSPQNQSNYKNNNDLLISKRGDFSSSINAQDSKREYCDNHTYKIYKDKESDIYEEKINSSSYRPYANNLRLFNGNHKNLVISNNIDNYNNIEKNRENCSYYESKYSRKNNTEKDNNKFNEKNSTYNKENYNFDNISSSKNIIKNSRIDSNFSINNEIFNSNFKKRVVNIPNNRINLLNSNNTIANQKRVIQINNQNIINSNKKEKNNLDDNKKKNISYSSTSSNHLDTFKDPYRSPIKKIKIETVYENSNTRKEINLQNKSLDKNQIKTKDAGIFENNKANNQNKRVEMIKDNKSKIIEIKKIPSISLRKIPYSPREKATIINTISNRRFKNNISNNKDSNNKIKNNYSFTTIKSRDVLPNIDKKTELNEKKGVKLKYNKTFKKSISTEINRNFDFKNFEKGNNLNLYKSKLKTIEVEAKPFNKEKNIKIVNVSYINNSNYNNNQMTECKKNAVLNRLKKGKSELLILGDKKDNGLIRRLHSQQRINVENGIKDEKINNSSKIINLKNNIVNSNSFDQNQRYTNEISINRIYNIDNYSRNNSSSKKISVIYNNNNKENKINHLNSITIRKINPPFLESNSHLTSNKKNSALTNTINAQSQNQKNRRHLSEIPKYQTRITIQVSGNNNNNNDEEDWDNNEFLGLKKKTYDPARRQKKKCNENDQNNLNKKIFIPSEIFTQSTLIKSCESITVPGRKENGNKKINQDSYIIERNINGILNFNIFGVLDGHGEDGHYASQFVKRYMINHIKNNPLIKKCEDPKEIYAKLTQNGYSIIANLFTDVDIQIQKEKFDYKNSGTTCVLVIQLEDKIICANTGDSRAIMIFDKSRDDNLINSKIYPLSYDCKPELPNERKRIYECGGCVEKALDENDEEGGPYRVWAYGEDYPGLAMSRSIGDMDAKKIGVIPNPQIIEYNINYNTKYMLICSDGIWEFINNEEAMKIGNKFYLRNDAMGLCQELYRKSVDYWLQEDIVVDDITAIAVFF